MKTEKSGNLKNSAQSSRNPVFTLIKIIKDASHVKIEDFQNAEWTCCIIRREVQLESSSNDRMNICIIKGTEAYRSSGPIYF